ncbi:hypothetical protein LFM09_04900 [Lentzea alba]|uniref:hypothetical protein n=1 Tax=Lentzea alba TaxID=2714351 RepID=UPI0039BF4C1D
MNELGIDAETRVPLIDGVPLTERIDTFELRARMKPAGDAYGGLTSGSNLLRPGRGVAVLGCSCGDVGCWPLLADITVDGDTIVWNEFRQPYREDRDYTRFGPFRFDRAQYEAALEKLSELG